MYKGQKKEMWGVERSQNSYNNGVWRDYKTEIVENQTKALLPYNDITKTFYYNTRSIISADLPEPITWRVTKIEGLSNKGNIMFTFAQDLFDQNHDYIERDEDGKLIGMWANYTADDNLPVATPQEPDPSNYGDYAEMSYTGAEPHIKVNGSYKSVTVSYYNSNELLKDQTPGEWSYYIDNTDAGELVKVLSQTNPNTVKIKFLGDETYLGKVLIVKNTRGNITAELQLQIVAL